MIPKLEVSHLCYSYHTMEGETEALSDLSFQVQTGEFLAVVGPSGCGKSTLLSLICGLLKPDSGRILLDGQPVLEGDTRIGYMLQKDHLFEWRTIRSNACLGLEIQKKMDPDHEKKVEEWRTIRENAALGLEIQHQKTREAMQELDEMLRNYGLAAFASARPSELSGGMRQRAALIRTLALEPDLLLLDEPFSALDYQTRLTVCDDISTIIRSRKKTAVLITHDLSEAVSAADRILILTRRPGRIKDTISITFPKEADSPLKRRNFPEFSVYFNEVWKILKE